MYYRTSRSFILSDSPAQIDFHIRNDDYFSFLATLMGFLEEALSRSEIQALCASEQKIAREMRHDLRYVQANYKIVPRELADIQTMRGKGNLLTKQYR